MIVDSGQDVSQVGLWIKAVHLGRFNHCHCPRGVPRRCLPRRITNSSSDSNRAQGAFSRIVINGYPTVFEEQAEGGTSAEPIAEGLGQVALAGDQRKLALGPREEGVDLRDAVFLACGKADISRLTGDFALDFIECADTVQRLAGDGGFGFAQFVMEITPQMRPARCLAQPGCSIRGWIIELGIPLVSISLQDAVSVGQMAMDVFFLPIRREGVDRAGWRRA